MKDRFSSQSKDYAAFRPTYPPELFELIFKQVTDFHSAWDVGTGNGQVARDLASKFSNVQATDISEQQLMNAVKAPNISYSIAGEVSTFPDNTFDLITVGQAIHWFDVNRFYSEVRRVSKPDAILAVWGYGLLRIEPSIDRPLDHFYTAVIGPYWDKERKLIDDHYRSLPFPFEKINTPDFSLTFSWSLDEFHGYLTTWSSVAKYTKANGRDPVEPFIEEIRELWGGKVRRVSFPLFLKLAKVH